MFTLILILHDKADDDDKIFFYISGKEYSFTVVCNIMV